MEKKFIINPGTGKLKIFKGEFKEIPGVSHNGQHYQLADNVLVSYNYRPDGYIYFSLLHPDTQPTMTGHIDLIARLPKNGRGEFELFRYTDMAPVKIEDLEAEECYLWPTGQRSLERVLQILRSYFFLGYPMSLIEEVKF